MRENIAVADLLAIREDLLNKNNVRILSSDEMGPLVPRNIRSIQGEGFSTFNEDNLLAYKKINGFSIYWRYKVNSDLGGEINIQNVTASFWAGWTDKLWFNNSGSGAPYSKEYDKFCRDLYGMDVMEQSMDSTRIAAFYIDRSKLGPQEPFNPNIWLFNSAGPTYLLTLKFKDYLEKLLVTKGFFGWQLFYLDWDGMDLRDPMTKEWLFPHIPSIKAMDNFLEYMPKIFPDQDYTEFHQLYDNWIKKAKEKGFNL